MGVPLRHPQRERSPAATQLENRLAVTEIGPLTSHVERSSFGISQCQHALRPMATAVLQPGPQHRLKEIWRHFVVLLVRAIGHDGHWTGAALGHEPSQMLLRTGRIQGLQGTGPPPQQMPNYSTDQAVGTASGFGGPHQLGLYQCQHEDVTGSGVCLFPNKLPDVHGTFPEGSFAVAQVELPHAKEPLVEAHPANVNQICKKALPPVAKCQGVALGELQAFDKVQLGMLSNDLLQRPTEGR